MTAPERIELDATARTLTLHWANGQRQSITHAALRAGCACASCRRQRANGAVKSSRLKEDREVSVLNVVPMGYGVQLIFSDGHDRGIFPWPYLEQWEDAPHADAIGPLPA
jgi:DUF971 family protein